MATPPPSKRARTLETPSEDLSIDQFVTTSPSTSKILSPYVRPPRGMNMARVLLVGLDGVGKRTLAGALKAQESTMRRGVAFAISTTASLPLEPGAEASLCVDFVVLLCSLTLRASYDSALLALKSLSAEWFLGRVAVVVTHADESARHAVSVDALLQETDAVNVPVFVANLKAEASGGAMAASVAELAAAAAGARGRFSYLLAKTFDKTLLAASMQPRDGLSSMDTTPPSRDSRRPTSTPGFTPGTEQRAPPPAFELPSSSLGSDL
eukprot:c53034_g1_i1.p1 GENE.c53034_g1_i1~~c53034_g1_i1.p1  ORF type:complete len:267 (+),score=44.32 c53034_g1_i1:133-933(+)